MRVISEARLGRDQREVVLAFTEALESERHP
jgi:hypothetical protein